MVTMLHIVELLAPYGGVPVKLFRLAEAIDPERGRLVFTVFQPGSLDGAISRLGTSAAARHDGRRDRAERRRRLGLHRSERSRPRFRLD